MGVIADISSYRPPTFAVVKKAARGGFVLSCS
jgi:hypothetical protein